MHVVVGLLPCMLLDDVACLHVERNMLVEASYLDIEDSSPHIGRATFLVAPKRKYKKIKKMKNKIVLAIRHQCLVHRIIGVWYFGAFNNRGTR